MTADRADRWSRAIPPALAVFGATFVLLGVWAAVHSTSFTEALADFGPQNDHLIHDYGAASVAVGATLLAAVRRPSWWPPALLVAALWNGLHAVSHLVDLGDAASAWLGIAEAVALVATTALMAALLAALTVEAAPAATQEER